MEANQHFLFVTIDGGGNLPPVLGLASRLKLHGHSISVLTEPCLEKVITSKGFTFIPFERYFTRQDRREDIIKDWNAPLLGPDPTIENVVLGPAKTVVEETHRVLNQQTYDVLIVDCLLPPAMIAGEYFSIPTTCVFHMPEYLPAHNRPPGMFGLKPASTIWGRFRDRLLGGLFDIVIDKYLKSINDIRSSYSLPDLKHVQDLFTQADKRLILTLREFDFPIEPPPSNVVYTGPVLDDPDWPEPWSNPWPEDDERPLVVLSLSSTFQNQAEVIRKAIDALGQLNVRGLVTLGMAMENEIFHAPDNVKVLNSASHSEVFPHADLVITHAGHGTLMRALAHGLPLICLPMGRDQKDNACKVDYHGCGLRLSPKANAYKIKNAITKILGNPSYLENAKRFQTMIRRELAEDKGLSALRSLGASAHRRFATE